MPEWQTKVAGWSHIQIFPSFLLVCLTCSMEYIVYPCSPKMHFVSRRWQHKLCCFYYTQLLFSSIRKAINYVVFFKVYCNSYKERAVLFLILLRSTFYKFRISSIFFVCAKMNMETNFCHCWRLFYNQFKCH